MNPWPVATWALVLLVAVLCACAAVATIVYTYRELARGRLVKRGERRE